MQVVEHQRPIFAIFKLHGFFIILLAFRRLGLCVTIANVAGYIVIWITVCLSEHFHIFMY
jgi:hypothetical protein